MLQLHEKVVKIRFSDGRAESVRKRSLITLLYLSTSSSTGDASRRWSGLSGRRERFYLKFSKMRGNLFPEVTSTDFANKGGLITVSSRRQIAEWDLLLR